MAGITKRIGEIGAESIHTFPETGERPRKVQALVQSLTRFSSSSLFPLNFNLIPCTLTTASTGKQCILLVLFQI